MEPKQMNPNRIQLGWFNAWMGLIWITLLIHSICYFFAYNIYLNISYSCVFVHKYNVIIDNNDSVMKINTDSGTFFYSNKDNFIIMKKFLRLHKHINIWYDKDDSGVANIGINNKFALKRSKIGIIVYLTFGIIFSAFVTTLSVILLIKTKGWGTYDLLEKHRQKKKNSETYKRMSTTDE